MSTSWQLQDAKNRFSEVVEQALHTGPQTVTRRGEPVVVLSIETWRQLSGPSLKDYLRAAPWRAWTWSATPPSGPTWHSCDPSGYLCDLRICPPRA
jgi:antitoxin Phd